MIETLVANIQSQIQRDMDDAFLRLITGVPPPPPPPIPETRSASV